MKPAEHSERPVRERFRFDFSLILVIVVAISVLLLLTFELWTTSHGPH